MSKVGVTSSIWHDYLSPNSEQRDPEGPPVRRRLVSKLAQSLVASRQPAPTPLLQELQSLMCSATIETVPLNCRRGYRQMVNT